MSDFWLGMIFNGMMSAVVIFFVLLVGTDIIRRQKDIRSRLRTLEILIREQQKKEGDN